MRAAGELTGGAFFTRVFRVWWNVLRWSRLEDAACEAEQPPAALEDEEMTDQPSCGSQSADPQAGHSAAPTVEDTQARVLQMTTDLRSLVRELSFLCGSQRQGAEEILTFEIMENFKSSVDAMRQLLWRYVESTFGASGSRMEMREPRLRRAAQILVSLSQPGAPTPFPAPAKLSFFEHIELIVARHIPAPELSLQIGR